MILGITTRLVIQTEYVVEVWPKKNGKQVVATLYLVGLNVLKQKSGYNGQDLLKIILQFITGVCRVRHVVFSNN